jgi:hypothetical protein
MAQDEIKKMKMQLALVNKEDSVLQAVELMNIISDLSVAFSALENSFLTSRKEEMSTQYIAALDHLAEAFEAAVDALANRNELISNATSLSKK